MSSFAPPRLRHRSTSRLHHWEPIRRGHVFRAFIVLVIALVGFGIVLYRASNAQFRSARPYKHSEEQTSQRGFESCMLFFKWRPKYAVNSSHLFTYEIPGPKDRTRTKATK
jgi:hypothetical protein